ncbi:gluconokinase [Ancylobacter sp. Lp-2]|uniref:gluconokinase n=1 Tax=Ancylobacter sp. Lp-2 TaxID=2881339 RepID=UPI001E647412|nr:gluconokinase [Ancylobacter sp. Lp-2]MCB4768713.1 gluconokinase [Ancylobacter sp. Lp-2]
MTVPDFVVVMGVAGAGKSTVAQQLASALGAAFIEADALHPPENVARMRQGIGLTDAMRWPWLEAVCAAARAEPRRPVVIACSALRAIYRDFLRERLAGVRFVYLHGPRELIAERLRARPGHFAGITLLDSQLATLEAPEPGEGAVAVSLTLSPEAMVAEALRGLHAAERVPG